MEANKQFLVLLVLALAILIPCLQAIPDVSVETTKSLNATSILGFNTTRRELKRKYNGPCLAVNPIDKCWRCQANWADNRQRLADCGMGFGYQTKGGKGGPFYVVTDASDDDVQEPRPGTLRHAVIQDGPLWITFANSMIITLQQELIMTSNKTIDGRGYNVRIAYGAGITIQFIKNVIIHNIHIHDIVQRPGGLIRDSVDHFGIRTASDGDAISIFGSRNIWVDHVSGWRCADGLIDVVAGSTDVTISNCHFTKHNEVMLFGASDIDIRDDDMRVTVAFNHFGKGLVQRMPRCRRGFVHVVNNDYTHWQMYAIGGSSNPTILSQGNRFIAHNNAATKEVTKRDPIPEYIWKQWSWQTEDDYFLNGAVFKPSGSEIQHNYNDKQIIKHYSGKMASKLTMFAGQLPCKVGKAC